MTPPQWFAPLPAGFFRSAPKVGMMRAEFGTLGVAIPAALLAEAELQKQLGGPRGHVRIAYADLAYLVATDADTARAIVARWIGLGEMVGAILGEYSFEATWKDWDRWQAPPASPELDRAKEFLAGVLRHGAQPTKQVNRLAGEAGISERTLERAREALGVRAAKVGPRTVLSIPADLDETGNSAKSAKSATQREVEVETRNLYYPNETSSSGESVDEVARLCHLLARTVREDDPSARVAPDGVAWRDACARLLEDFEAEAVEMAIAATAGEVRTMPNLGEWMRANGYSA